MITKKVTENGKLVITRLSGNISSDEVMEDFLSMFKIAGQLNPKGFSHLYDMSAVTSISVQENDIRRMTSLGMAERMGDTKVCTAIVATEPDCLRLAHLHRDLSNRFGLKEVEVFGEERDAMNWLQGR